MDDARLVLHVHQLAAVPIQFYGLPARRIDRHGTAYFIPGLDMPVVLHRYAAENFHGLLSVVGRGFPVLDR